MDLDRLNDLRAMLPVRAFAEQISMLLEMFMPSVDSIGAAVQSGQLADGAKVAHDLVSAAGNYGAQRVSDIARKLEGACRRSEPDAAAQLYAALRPAAQEAITVLQAIRRDAA